jgi:hypothetical protein
MLSRAIVLGARLLALLVVGSGCPLLVVDEQDLCEDVSCGERAHCDAGVCKCDHGFRGDAAAPNACFSIQPEGTTCGEGCGANASCVDGRCVCDEGWVGACGAGCLEVERVCDGVLDCGAEPEDSPDEAWDACRWVAYQEWVVWDACLDDADTQWRLWSMDRDWAWPSGTSTFSTFGLDVEIHETIECFEGETVCVGAQADDRTWGVGLDGTAVCTDCCMPCAQGMARYGGFACN